MLDGKSTIPSSHTARAEKLLREKCKLGTEVNWRLKIKLLIMTNEWYSFRVPVGTTPELQDLLFGLLRRNAKERMPFDVFFIHPFLQRHPPVQQQQAAGETKLNVTNLNWISLNFYVDFLQLICRRHSLHLKNPTTPQTSTTLQQHRTTITTIMWKMVSDLHGCQLFE